jgi:hypothetical protein
MLGLIYGGASSEYNTNTFLFLFATAAAPRQFLYLPPQTLLR